MTESELRAALEGVEHNTLAPRLRHMIDHIARRIEYAEGRRSFFLTSAGVSMAAGFAVLGIVSTKPLWLPWEFAFWTLGISLVAFAVTVWLVHASHVNFSYPFTDVASVPKWFYRYAIPDWKKYHFPLRWNRLTETEKSEDRSKFDADFLLFLENSRLHLLDEKESSLQDVKQIYLLHVNEMYKNTFLTALRRTFEIGLKRVFFFTAAAFVVGLFLNQLRWPGSDARQQSGLSIKATWEPTSITASSSGNLNVQVINPTNNSITVQGIEIRNKRGFLIPFEIVQTTTTFPFTLGAATERTLVLVIDLKANSLASMKTVGLRQSP